MEHLSLELPALFGDHHVIEVRRILAELPGIQEIYASSGFRQLEVIYDPDLVQETAVRQALEAAGYTGDLELPAETGALASNGDRDSVFFRHSVAYTQTGKALGFAQQVPETGRALWPCPGMGPVKIEEEEEREHA